MDGAADVNQSGTFTTWTSYAANYTVSDTTSGRGIMILPPLVGGVPQSLNLVSYVVNAGKQFAMEVDPATILTRLLNGVVLQHQGPPPVCSGRTVWQAMAGQQSGSEWITWLPTLFGFG